MMKGDCSRRGPLFRALLLVLALFATSCERPDPVVETQDSAELLALQANVSHLSLIAERRIEDLDGMLERRTIRALVVRSRTFYFLDGAEQRGLSYEMLKAFERFVNSSRERTALKVNLVFIPVNRDQLIPALRQGYGDLAVANLTITPRRRQFVDFSDPVYEDVREVLALGPESSQISKLEDLSGNVLYTRRSSSYYDSLLSLNERFEAQGQLPLTINPVDEHLEDEELLEMVDAGLIPGIVIDSHKAEFWAEIFPSVDMRFDLVLREGGNIAWAFNHDKPQLKELVNEFLSVHGRGSLVGNMLFRRYLVETNYLHNALQSTELKKFNDTAYLFQLYADRYEFDWLMVISQAYQESRLDHSARSNAGAVGIMQLLPGTAADKNVDVGDITDLENNIHAGNKYLRFIRNRYFESEPMDDLNKTLFSFASYNAGPARIARLRVEAQQKGLDPNVWFDNVEVIAARRVGREPVDYVSNIYKYWIAFTLSRERLTAAAEQVGAS